MNALHGCGVPITFQYNLNHEKLDDNELKWNLIIVYKQAGFEVSNPSYYLLCITYIKDSKQQFCIFFNIQRDI